MISDYVQHKLYAVAILLVVIGGLNWGYVAFTGKDFVTYALGKGALANAIFLFVGLAAIAIAFYRDTYLPFLGQTVMPCSVLQASTPEGADVEIRVFVKPDAKVMYWAAEPANKDLKGLQDWRQAYLSYRNAGVAIADGSGYALLKMRKPQPYFVPLKGELMPHVHYRVCHGEGMLGRVQTVTLDGKEYFANVDEEDEHFGNIEDEEEHFANFEEEEDHFANMEEEEEHFANMEEEEDHFANVVDQPEPVTGIAAPSFPANNAMGELNTVAKQTARANLMAEEGGLVEAPHPRGAELEAAFAPPAPVKYSQVNYA